MFMDQKFEKIVSIIRVLVLFQRFEKLNLLGLGIYDKYQRIFSYYGKDIENVFKLYQKNKNDLSVVRDLFFIVGEWKFNYDDLFLIFII